MIQQTLEDFLAAEMPDQQTVQVLSSAAEAGVRKIIIVEALNGLRSLYGYYAKPYVTDYFDGRREERLKAHAQKMDAEQLAIDTLEADDWVMLGFEESRETEEVVYETSENVEKKSVRYSI